jgi:hypothetical protein
MNQVEVFVPCDNRSATTGGAGGFYRFFMFIFSCYDMICFVFRCVFHPVTVYKTYIAHKQLLQQIDLRKKQQEEENVRNGKNPDGSFTKVFPGSTTLREALKECGLYPEYEEYDSSILKVIGDTSLERINQTTN